MDAKRNVKIPQLNKFMHPRNPYKFISFKQLAISYPGFRAHCIYDVNGKVHLDFKNKEALKALITVLFDRDYGLKLNIPEGRLIPTLPLRLNYLLWIEDLLSLVYGNALVSKESVIGFDIGTGAACVYPFIGTKRNRWHFIATEADEVSFESARENVTRNDMESFILLKKSSNFFDILNEPDVLNFLEKVKQKDYSTTIGSEDSKAIHSNENHQNCKGDFSGSYLVDFTMCNPPFFSSEAEMDPHYNSKKKTRSEPVSASTGSIQECVTEGGEIAFVKKLIETSFQYKKHIRIFSTMIGKKNHVKPVVQFIKEKANDGFVCVSRTEFCQGRTMRWGVAWTFDPDVPLENVRSKRQQLSQKPIVLDIPRSQMSSYTVQVVWTKILAWLKDIKIKPHLMKSNKYFVTATIRVYKATWLHQRQKRRKKHVLSAANSQLNNGDQHEKRRNQDQENTNLQKKRKLDMEKTASETNDNSQHVFNESLMENVIHEARAGAMNSTSDETSTNLDDDASASKTPNQVSSSGLKCLLRARLTLKQTEGLISVELKYISGTGKKEAVNQLLQYLRNKMQRGD